MTRLGFGFPAGQRTSSPGGSTSIATIQPASGWNGQPGSGFTSVPSDPVRLTAKPTMQLLVPPRQAFTDQLTIGVLAMANRNGSMSDDLGLAHVKVHYEGTTNTIKAPSLHQFSDVNGVARSYYGWWVTLEHSGLSGEAQVYFEAVPRDSSMQNRVMGPYSFFPAAQQYDFEIEVAPSQPIITNQRYPSIRDAGNSLRAQGSQHGRILITESGSYDLLPILASYSGESYCTIEATQPITIAKAAYDPTSGAAETNGLLRLKYDGLWFKGSNITIDMEHISTIYHESPANPQNVFEGVTITDSKGRGALWLKGQKPTPYICRDNPYYLECNVSVVQNAFNNASLVRGCDYSDGAHDAFSYARCTVGCTLTGHHNEDWRNPIDALSVQYTGPNSTATISLTGGNDTNNRVLSAYENGSLVGTFTIKNTTADYNTGTNYDVADAAAWLNSLPDWTAAVLDDSRRASALSHQSAGSLGGSFAALDVKTGPATLHTVFDAHGDTWAINQQASKNSIFYGNLMHSNDLPAISFGYVSHEDLFFVNNTVETDEALNPNFAFQFSQWNKPGSHVVIAHNSFANQKLLLRQGLGMSADPYCLVANNTAVGVDWDGTPDANLTVSDNHFHANATVPAGSINTSLGGDQQSLFVDAANGNFAPSGELTQFLKTRAVKPDRIGSIRNRNAPAGSEA